MKQALMCVLLSLGVCVSATGLAAQLWGTVTAVDGEAVVIQLRAGQDGAVPVPGDTVGLTYTAFGETIVVGEWAVATVYDGGAVRATPVDVMADPQLNMEAVVHASGVAVGNAEAAKTEPQGASTKPASAGAKMPPKSDPPPAREMDLDELGRLARAYYYGGNGKPQDFGKALALYRRRCTAGVMDDCVSVGRMLQKGQGTAKDLQGAQDYFQRSNYSPPAKGTQSPASAIWIAIIGL